MKDWGSFWELRRRGYRRLWHVFGTRLPQGYSLGLRTAGPARENDTVVCLSLLKTRAFCSHPFSLSQNGSLRITYKSIYLPTYLPTWQHRIWFHYMLYHTWATTERVNQETQIPDIKHPFTYNRPYNQAIFLATEITQKNLNKSF